jgi:uncharacterized RDD family membrane protein YckC
MQGRFPFRGSDVARRRPGSLQLATLRRRFLAALINATIAIVALALTLGVGVLVGGRVLDLRSARRGRTRAEGEDWRALSARLQSTPAKLVLHLVGLAITAVATGHRSPGFRLLGLRHVDAQSGGEVTRRQELISSATRDASRIVSNRLFPAAKVDGSLDHEKLHSELDATRREYGADREAMQRAMMRIYRANKVDPRVSCLRALPRVVFAMATELPVWSSQKQSLPDRLAGTIIVVDRKSVPRRRRPVYSMSRPSVRS